MPEIVFCACCDIIGTCGDESKKVIRGATTCGSIFFIKFQSYNTSCHDRVLNIL